MSRAVKIIAAVVAYEITHTGTDITDLTDLGNEIGVAIQPYLSDDEMGFDLDDLINGVKHGVSLMDGTHNKEK